MPTQLCRTLCAPHRFRRLAEGQSCSGLELTRPIVSSRVRRESTSGFVIGSSLVMTLRLKVDGTVGAVLFLEAIRGVPAPATFYFGTSPERAHAL